MKSACLNIKRIISIIIVVCICGFANAQVKAKADTSKTKKTVGVAVSPASMHLEIKPGTTVIKEITINNDTKKLNKFKIGFSDFTANREGKPSPASKDSKYALSKYVNLVPSYVELKPGEITKIKVIINIPDSADFSTWTIITIDQSNERPKLDASPSPDKMAMGVIPSVGFGVYIYQNPPNVKNNNVDILNFSTGNDKKDNSKEFLMEIKNTGDGIAYTAAYVEVVNLNDGKKTRLPSTMFTLLPQFTRDLVLKFPKNLTPGKYSAIGVVDFGSKDQINGQEIEFSIP